MDELPITQTKQTFKGPIACMKPDSKDKFLQRRGIVMLSFSRFMLVLFLFIDFMWTQEMVNDAFSCFCVHRFVTCGCLSIISFLQWVKVGQKRHVATLYGKCLSIDSY